GGHDGVVAGHEHRRAAVPDVELVGADDAADAGPVAGGVADREVAAEVEPELEDREHEQQHDGRDDGRLGHAGAPVAAESVHREASDHGSVIVLGSGYEVTGGLELIDTMLTVAWVASGMSGRA